MIRLREWVEDVVVWLLHPDDRGMTWREHRHQMKIWRNLP